jgi:predicted Zn-dependent protease
MIHARCTLGVMSLVMIARGLAVAGLLWAGAVAAQAQLASPQEVVILIHRDLENAEFVEPLVCELSRTLVAPVRARPIDLPLDLGLMASPTQLDALKVATRLRQTTASEIGPETFAFLLVPHDLTSARFRYVFGASFGRPYNNGVVSTARLAASTTGAEQPVHLVMLRTYKIILRYVAQLAGLWEQDGCVLAMPRGVEELDAKPSEFCDADRAVLVEAGVVKAYPDGACGRTAAVR